MCNWTECSCKTAMRTCDKGSLQVPEARRSEALRAYTAYNLQSWTPLASNASVAFSASGAVKYGSVFAHYYCESRCSIISYANVNWLFSRKGAPGSRLTLSCVIEQSVQPCEVPS